MLLKIKIVLVMVFLILLASVIGFSASCSPSANILSVFAAAGAKPALDEIGQKFEELYDVAVEISFGGGGEALNQMVLSESGDVYIAPEQSFMQTAVTKNAVDTLTIESVAYMIPVIAVQKGNPHNIMSLADLARPGIRVGVTRAETTLLGKYAPEIFSKAGLAEDIGKNIVTEAIRPDSLLTALVMGQVDAGIIWHFYQLQAPDDIEVIFLPPEQLTGIGEIQIAVTTYCQNVSLAWEFIDFVTSPEGKEIFKKYGYFTDAGEVSQYRQ
ncbi:MAG: molybdate ABC transporter substrate-binding protein [Dehalococcoidales bacterium]|nr:molybdate ABC transporter substrate-binding protein [Dehalococcoidales bacterium]